MQNSNYLLFDTNNMTSTNLEFNNDNSAVNKLEIKYSKYVSYTNMGSS